MAWWRNAKLQICWSNFWWRLTANNFENSCKSESPISTSSPCRLRHNPHYINPSLFIYKCRNLIWQHLLFMTISLWSSLGPWLWQCIYCWSTFGSVAQFRHSFCHLFFFLFLGLVFLSSPLINIWQLFALPLSSPELLFTDCFTMLQICVSVFHNSLSIYDWLVFAGTPIFAILLTVAVFVFWLLSVYSLLSVRGMKREEMGRLGKMVDGVDVVVGGICTIAKGVRIILCCKVQVQVSCPFLFFE